MQNLRKTNETGRSMVEMLGVLAIIGVLSVAGVAGYKAAVRKALANNLLNQASMRATDVATQIGSGNLDSLGNDAFDGNLGSGVTMSSAVKGPDGYTDYDESDEQFTLTLEGLDEEMCQQMQSMAGGSRSVVREVECVNNADGDLVAILTFNKDLSANPVASDFEDNEEGCENSGRKYCDNDTCIPATEECPTGGSSFNPDGATEDDGSDCSADTKLGTECQVCIKGSYQDSDAKCEPGQICVDGACTIPGDSDYTGCTRNSDCKGIVDGVDCDEKTCYCNYYDNDKYKMHSGTCEGGPDKGSGVCMEATYYTTTVADDGIAGKLSTREMDWYSVKNFCSALGGSMISLKGSGIDKSKLGSSFANNGFCYGSDAEKCDSAGIDWKKYKGKLSSTYWWTKDLRDGANSCYAFGVSTSGSSVGYDPRNSYSYGYYYALCE